MVKISLWNNGAKNADYRFIDRQIRDFIESSGTAIFLHKYEGTHGQNGEPDKSILEIQDVVLQENRDRKYSKEVYELRGCYNVADTDFNLLQFGLFLTGDTIFIEVHINEMLSLLGRKIIPGDVIELPHLRDDALLNEGKAVNKFYVVEDANRASDGYSSTWLPHLWRIKCSPMTAGQEYADILDKSTTDPFGLSTGSTIADIISTLSTDLATNEAIVEEAKIHVFARNFETRQFYMIEGEENPWIFAGDGIPPNGGLLLDSGDTFPINGVEGTYYLRTDYQPHALFKKVGSAWQMQELDYRRGQWTACHRLLEDFLKESGTTTLTDGRVFDTRQALSKIIRPEADF
jgi:hypothetical protein